MNHLKTKTLACAGVLLVALVSSAQYPAQPPDATARADARIFDRVRRDVDRAAALTQPNSGDRDRLEVARNEVNECARIVAGGTYDRRIFGQMMDALQRVLDLNQLSKVNRDRLVDDMSALREIQARLER